MKINLQNFDHDNFLIFPHDFHGEEVKLIIPNHIGCQWSKETMFQRSVVVNSEGDVISLSFPKFFNLGEKPDLYPDVEKFNDGVAMEKIDGCCEENVILITENGEKTIKEICETKYSGKVLGYNHDLEKEEFSKIIEYSILENNDDWYELTLADNSTIKLTGNHRVWLPELNCYRMVKDLIGNEEFLLKK
jgi:hypothetical protein